MSSILNKNIYFIKQIFIWSFPLLIGLLVLGVIFYGESVITGILWGYLLGLINIITGYLSIELSAEKSINTFFKYLIVGMFIRIFLLLMIIIILVKISGINVYTLIFSLFLFYIINLILEINYINNRFKKRK